MQELPKTPTGIEGLDRILHGGFVRGSAYIVQGPPGAGKTILANQLCFAHAKAGANALYVSLLAESHERMLTYMGQMKFFDAAVIPSKLQYISGYPVLERDGLVGLLKLIQHEIRHSRASVVVLDGLFVVESASGSEHEFRKFVHELQGISNLTRAVLIALTHQTITTSGPEQTMVDGWIEIVDELKGLQSYRTIRVKKHRGAGLIEGKHKMRISEAGLTVFPRIEAVFGSTAEIPAASGRLSIGHARLDEVLSGGVPEASATLLLGPAGAGKTTLGLHFLACASESKSGVMLGFYEAPARLSAKAHNLGLDLDGRVRQGHIQMIWRSPVGNLLDEVVTDLLETVERRRARRVFIDGIAALRNILIYKERFTFVLNSIANRLRQLGATSMFTDEVREMYRPEFMPMDSVSSIVDNVISLHYRREPEALRRELSVLKLRDSDFDPRSHEMHIGPRGLAMGPDPRIVQ